MIYILCFSDGSSANIGGGDDDFVPVPELKEWTDSIPGSRILLADAPPAVIREGIDELNRAGVPTAVHSLQATDVDGGVQ